MDIIRKCTNYNLMIPQFKDGNQLFQTSRMNYTNSLIFLICSHFPNYFLMQLVIMVNIFSNIQSFIKKLKELHKLLDFLKKRFFSSILCMSFPPSKRAQESLFATQITPLFMAAISTLSSGTFSQGF